MVKIKSKNSKVEENLHKVSHKSITSKEQALKTANIAKIKQLRKNPEKSVIKKQFKEKKELFKKGNDETTKAEKDTSQVSKKSPKLKKNKHEKLAKLEKKNKRKSTEPKESSSELKPSPEIRESEQKTEINEQLNKQIDKTLSKKKKKLKLNHNENQEKEKKVSDPESTIFVGNLPQNIKKQQLISLFKPCGKIISVRLRTALGNTLFKHFTRKETECLNGYVVFASPENALEALKMSGTEFHGKHIRVTKSLKGNFVTEESSKKTIFLGNLKFKVTEETLHELFSSCGEIAAVRTMKNNKGCKGTAYVTFKSKESVNLALELNGTLIFERPVRVEKYSVRKLKEKSKAVSESKIEKNDDGKTKTKKLKVKKEKKGDFRGNKISMKKNKLKKKLGGNPLQRKLAKKIAPKDS